MYKGVVALYQNHNINFNSNYYRLYLLAIFEYTFKMRFSLHYMVVFLFPVMAIAAAAIGEQSGSSSCGGNASSKNTNGGMYVVLYKKTYY